MQSLLPKKKKVYGRNVPYSLHVIAVTARATLFSSASFDEILMSRDCIGFVNNQEVEAVYVDATGTWKHSSIVHLSPVSGLIIGVQCIVAYL